MKNLNKKQRIWGSVLIVFAAVMTLLAIIFGVYWGQAKKTLSNFKSNITLNFDMDNDKKIDYSYTFSGTYGGKTLEEIVKNDMPSDSVLKFTFKGDMLTAITSPKGTEAMNDSHYWSIYSSTSSNVNTFYDAKNGGWGFDTPYDWDSSKTYEQQKPKEFHTTVGLPGLAMGPTNEFTFSYISY